MFAMGLVVGRVFDRYGPRSLLLGGNSLHVLGLMMASISSTYYQLLLSQGVCSAIGVAAVFQPALNCIVHWFHKKRSVACGIVSSGSSLGGVVLPILVNRLMREVGYG
jgi:MFS transporter, MCT family, aspergillic acid transporter